MLSTGFVARKLTRSQDSATRWLLNSKLQTVAIFKEVSSRRLRDLSAFFKFALQLLQRLEIHH